MRVISCHLENFASYKELNFTFENQGLTLIQGPTGSGKSTLCDAIPWVLFGTTAKNGAVDDIRSWNTKERTYGSIQLDFKNSSIAVVRTRNPNDLYYIVDCVWELPKRGKDLADTQKMINNLLGFDSALYLSGAYFHEFSQTAQFFTTTAKNRRAICEQLVDLSLAKNLQLKIAEQNKVLTVLDRDYAGKIAICSSKLSYLKDQNDLQVKYESFETDKLEAIHKIKSEIAAIKKQVKSPSYFAEARAELQFAKSQLGDSLCSECGANKEHSGHNELSRMINQLAQEDMKNKHLISNIKYLEKDLAAQTETKNIYQDLMLKNAKERKHAKWELDGLIELQSQSNQNIEDYELLSEVVADLRGVTVARTIQDLENKTNKLLSDHFDAEIKVAFSTQEADKIEVSILKDGHNCSYTQLSKGQRQLLKLCFGVSVMRSVANHHGISFNCAFFDEALDGLDDIFKVQAYGLLEELSLDYESVFVVEHNEALKSMFPKSYKVQLVNGGSQIE